MEIKTLEGVDKKDILKVFNESFSDYFIPFQLSQEQLTLKMLADKTDLNLSVGVFENAHLIGFILHGFDKINNEKVIYNGGTGVIPEKRGSGLTKQMYHFILPILKKNRIDKLQLEVISENIPAINSYKKSGYKTERELFCYKGEIIISNTNDRLNIEKIQNYNWDLMQSFWDIYPTWQNSKNVMNDLKDNYISLGAYLENLLVGYIIYNPNNKRILQIAISPNFRRRQVASTLVHEIIETYGNTLSIINVDKSSKSINTFLKKIGFRSNLEQLEMKLHLA
jgi:ribosomal protein S18 acetylase RimI-like enzyme